MLKSHTLWLNNLRKNCDWFILQASVNIIEWQMHLRTAYRKVDATSRNRNSDRLLTDRML